MLPELFGRKCCACSCIVQWDFVIVLAIEQEFRCFSNQASLPKQVDGMAWQARALPLGLGHGQVQPFSSLPAIEIEQVRRTHV